MPAGAGGQTALQRLEMHRAQAHEEATPKEPESVALLHQLANDIEAPKPDAKMPDVPRPDSRESEKTPQVSSAAKLIEANEARPQRLQSVSVARSGDEESLALPGNDIVALAPSKAALALGEQRNSRENASPANKPASLNRSDRGSLDAPSSVIDDGGLAAKRPAAAGGSAGSRLDKTSSAAVERSANSQAPLGPTVAAAGSADFGTGSDLAPARMGSPDKFGQRRPGSERT